MLINSLKLSPIFWGLGTCKKCKAWIFRLFGQLQSPDFQFLKLCLGLATNPIKSRNAVPIPVPNSIPVCNTYRGERSSAPDVFPTYPARKSAALKISPAKQSQNFLLAVKTIPDLSVKCKYVRYMHASSSEDVCGYLALSSTKRLKTGENLTFNSGEHS